MKTVLAFAVTVALFAAVHTSPSAPDFFKGFAAPLTGLKDIVKNPFDKIKDDSTAAGTEIGDKISKQLDEFADKAKSIPENLMAPLKQLQEFMGQNLKTLEMVPEETKEMVDKKVEEASDKVKEQAKSLTPEI